MFADLRCDSEDYGAVNPLFSSPALVRPALLQPGPVCEGTEDDNIDLHEALTRQGYSMQSSHSSSQGSGVAATQPEARHGAWPKLNQLWSTSTSWLKKRKHSSVEETSPMTRSEQTAEGRLRTDMITIDVPSSRCSSVSQAQQHLVDRDDCSTPLPPLQTSNSPPESPTRRLTKQASNAASAVLVAISDASPIPRSPKPGPVANRSWFVDVSPRRGGRSSVRKAPRLPHQLQPVSNALKQCFLHQLLQQHLLNALGVAFLALLLGMLHGTGWQLMQLPAAGLGAILGLGLMTALASLPAFDFSPAASIAAVYSPAVFFSCSALLQALLAVVWVALFGSIYSSLVLPSIPFSSLYSVFLLVCCWCIGLAAFLAQVLRSGQMAAGVLAVLIALGGSLSGAFPSLRQMHPSPWFLLSGGLHTACACSPTGSIHAVKPLNIHVVHFEPCQVTWFLQPTKLALFHSELPMYNSLIPASVTLAASMKRWLTTSSIPWIGVLRLAR